MGLGLGRGLGVTQSCSPDPPRALLEPPEPLELTGESSEGRCRGRAGEGVPPDVGQEVSAGFWGHLGRAVGGRAGLGGHREVRGWAAFPPGIPQKRAGLTWGSVSPWRSWRAPGSAEVLWGGCFACSGATYLPREGKIWTEGSSRCAAQGDRAPSSSPTIVSSRISPEGTPSPSGGRWSRGAARSGGRRCRARPACRPAGVGEGTWGRGQGGMESAGPPEPLPYLIAVRLQEQHLGLGERRHGDGLDTVRGVQSPPGEESGGSAPPLRP